MICLQLPNWTEAVIYTYAASQAGRRRLSGHDHLPAARAGLHPADAPRCKVLVVPSTYRGFDYAAMARELADGLPHLEHIICVGDDGRGGCSCEQHSLVGPDSDPWTAGAREADDFAVLAFTSGTTGEAKGVMHSHASMTAAIDDFVDHAGFGDGLTSLVMSPFGHLTGFTWGILMPLSGAGDVVLLETWNAEQALDLVRGTP